jgi:hypothetical protein
VKLEEEAGWAANHSTSYDNRNQLCSDRERVESTPIPDGGGGGGIKHSIGAARQRPRGGYRPEGEDRDDWVRGTWNMDCGFV